MIRRSADETTAKKGGRGLTRDFGDFESALLCHPTYWVQDFASMKVHGAVYGMNEQSILTEEVDIVYLCQEWKLHLLARNEAELERGYIALASGALYHLKGRSKSSEAVKIYIKQESCQYNIFVCYP